MTVNFTALIGNIGFFIECLGVLVISVGVIGGFYRYLARYLRGSDAPLYEEFRHDIGRSLMVGLEFLVAGDIIRTVIISHTIADVAGLGLIVLIRTVLVFTTHLEVEGRWPWQMPAGNGNHEQESK